jgi:hypothetical protein
MSSSDSNEALPRRVLVSATRKNVMQINLYFGQKRILNKKHCIGSCVLMTKIHFPSLRYGIIEETVTGSKLGVESKVERKNMTEVG